MAEHRPLVVDNGEIKQIPLGDTFESDLLGSGSGSSAETGITYVELDEAGTGTENALAIQTLIDNGHKNIRISPGTFTMDQVFFTDNTYIQGSGIDVTTVILEGQNVTIDSFGGVFNLRGTSVDRIQNPRLSDLTVDGNKANITTSGSGDIFDVECVDLAYADNALIERVKCINSASEGIDYDECTDCKDIDCILIDCDGAGIHHSTNSLNINSIRAYVENCGFGRSRGGMDTHSTSLESKYISCKSVSCYRGVVLQGSESVVIAHQDDGSVNNNLRIEGDYNLVSEGQWKNCTSGNGITIDGHRNKIHGIIENAGAVGVNILSTSDRNKLDVTSRNNANQGIFIQGDLNIVVGCISYNNGLTNIQNIGTNNVVANNVTS